MKSHVVAGAVTVGIKTKSPLHRRWGDGRLPELALAGLLVVLVSLSAFAIWLSWSTSHAVERTIASITLSDHYSAAAAAVSEQEFLERKYRLEPSHQVRRLYDKASDRLLDALALVRRDGQAHDQVIAARVDKAYALYRQSIDKMFNAVDLGDTPLALRIDNDEVEPRFEMIEMTIRNEADVHHADALADLAILGVRDAFYVRATPAAFLAGLILVVLFSSVLRRARAELDMERNLAVHDALHDSLTGLPNRKLLAERFEQALRADRLSGTGSDRRASTCTGLLLIDLDRFKEVNDTLGHHIGDQLLSEIGPRVATTLRGVDLVARLGGDEFAVLLPDVDGLSGALDVATRLRKALEEPFNFDGIELDIDASIGVVISGVHGDDAITLMQRADVAMYVAKQQTSGVMVYDPENDDNSLARLALLGQLRRGIERDELFLHYQPKVNLDTGVLAGVEALVRWQHPERGMVPPDDFIPLAERTGLIGPLTGWVLDKALAQIKTWADSGYDIPVAVNVSARNLADDEFANKIAERLAHHDVPAGLLEIEVTESAVMLEPERAAHILNQIHGLGVHIAIDDFGAGYTSLAQLKNLPISELKIDKSFILKIDSNPDDALIVRSMIDLGHSLNMKIVAEGVENARSESMLAGYRCDIAQGHHLCRPVLPEALILWQSQRVVHPPEHFLSPGNEA